MFKNLPKWQATHHLKKKREGTQSAVYNRRRSPHCHDLPQFMSYQPYPCVRREEDQIGESHGRSKCTTMAHVTATLKDRSTEFSFASRVMDLEDIGHLVIDKLAFKDLLCYARTAKTALLLAKMTLRLRFKSLICIYVSFDVLSFRHLMLEVGAVIVGSAVVWMLSPVDRVPNNLNIVVPNGSATAIINYFSLLGYSTSLTEIDNVAFMAVTRVYHLHRGHLLVIVVESFNQHIIHLVTCTLNSMQMNIMTPDEIIIFYPEMTLEKVGMIGRRCYPSNEHCSKVPEGFNVIHTTDFTQYCGRNCPALYRRVRDIAGLARFNWAEIWDERGTFEWLCRGCHHKWRLGAECHNLSCRNVSDRTL
jgi:hypothetical protein